jgi:small-conductance mechanosensitive channel
VVIILAAIFLVRWLLRYLLDFIFTRLIGEKGKQLSNTMLLPLRRPLIYLFLLITLHLALRRLDFLITTDVAERLDDIFFVPYVIMGTILLWQLLTSLLQWYGDEIAYRTESELDEQILPFAKRFVTIVLVAINLIILLSRFNVDVSALVTTLGIGSLAIALAAQESLSDMISGMVIMMDRPYRINDRIEINELNTWGDIIDIGLRSTRIRTRDNRMVVVPNSVMSKSLIVNYSYPDDRYRIQIELGIAYGTDIEHARRTIVEAVKHVEGVLPDRPVEALFLRFGDSAMIMRVRWWLGSYEDTRQMFDRVNTALLEALEKAKIELPVPIQEVHHKFDETLAEQLTRT